MRHIWTRLAMAFLAIQAAVPHARAEEPYPSRPIRLVVPYTAGGSADVLGRAVGQQLAEAFRQTVIVDNKPGADGLLGADVVAKSPADGYTLLYGPNALFSIFPYMHPKAATSVRRDLEPAAMVSSAPLVMCVWAGLPVRSIPELIAYARVHPGEVSFGSSGNSSLHRMTGEHFAMQAGVRMTHVPYKGTSQAVSDLAGGSIQLLYGSLTSIEPLVRANKVRLLAVTSNKRFAGLPDLPSVAETLKGWPDFSTFQGLFVPKGTPQEAIDKISGAVAAALRSADLQKKLALNAFAANPGQPAEFKARLEADYVTMGRIIKAANIQPEE